MCYFQDFWDIQYVLLLMTYKCLAKDVLLTVKVKNKFYTQLVNKQIYLSFHANYIVAFQIL